MGRGQGALRAVRPDAVGRPERGVARAKKRGLPQMGTLGAGNHYAEIQVVDEIFDKRAAAKMGIDTSGRSA